MTRKKPKTYTTVECMVRDIRPPVFRHLIADAIRAGGKP